MQNSIISKIKKENREEFEKRFGNHIPEKFAFRTFLSVAEDNIFKEVIEWAEERIGEFHVSNPLNEDFDKGYDQALIDLKKRMEES